MKSDYERAMGSGEIDDSFVEEKMCPVCPFTTGEVDRGVDQPCEGIWCEEAFEKYATKYITMEEEK